MLALSVVVAWCTIPASVDRFKGVWTLNAEASDDLTAAIEKTIATMNFIARPIARTKLRARNVAFPKIDITAEDGGLRVSHQGGMNVKYSAVSQPVHVKAPDGTDAVTRLSATPTLILTYESESGTREDRYELSPEGNTLTLSIRMTSSRLPQPLLYQLVYRRG